MGEIKTEITKLEEGKCYKAGAEDYLITEKHTLADIVRMLVKMSSGTEEIKYLVKEIDEAEPELIQGYTAEQWQEIIDGGYLCGFSMVPFETNGHVRIGFLSSFSGNCFKLKRPATGDAWSYCRPAQIKGVMMPIWVKPENRNAACCFFNKHGSPLNDTTILYNYYSYVREFKEDRDATKYIEL